MFGLLSMMHNWSEAIETPLNIGVFLTLFHQDGYTPSRTSLLNISVHTFSGNSTGSVFFNMATEIPSFPVAFLSGIKPMYLATFYGVNFGKSDILLPSYGGSL